MSKRNYMVTIVSAVVATLVLVWAAWAGQQRLSGGHLVSCEDELRAAYHQSLTDPTYVPSQTRPAACDGLTDQQYEQLAVKVMTEVSR